MSLAPYAPRTPGNALMQQHKPMSVRDIMETRAAGMKASEIERQSRAADDLRRAIANNTKVTPEGPIIDRPGVIEEMRQRGHGDLVESELGKYTEEQTAAETSRREDADRQTAVIAEEIGNVDWDNPDQSVPASQYEAARRNVERRLGIQIPENDPMYNYDPDRVRYLQDKLIGQETMYKEDASTHREVIQERGRDTRDQRDRREFLYEFNNVPAETEYQEESETNREEFRQRSQTGRTAIQEEGANQRFNAEPAGKGGKRPSFAKGGKWSLTSPRGWRVHPITGERDYHDAEDWAAPLGTTFHAEEDGEVVSSGDRGGLGNSITIRYKDGRVRSYSHNSRNLVRRGQKIRKGQPIGKVGQTGLATGPHVHIQDEGGKGGLSPEEKRRAINNPDKAIPLDPRDARRGAAREALEERATDPARGPRGADGKVLPPALRRVPPERQVPPVRDPGPGTGGEANPRIADWLISGEGPEPGRNVPAAPKPAPIPKPAITAPVPKAAEGAAADDGIPLQEAEESEALMSLGDLNRQMRGLLEDFNPSFFGNVTGITGMAEQELKRRGLQSDPKGEADYWVRFNEYFVPKAFDIAGANFTPSEQKMLRDIEIKRTDDPAQAKRIMRRKVQVVENAIIRKVRNAVREGVSPRSLAETFGPDIVKRAMTGAAPARRDPGTGPRTVTDPQGRDWLQYPDGRLERKR